MEVKTKITGFEIEIKDSSKDVIASMICSDDYGVRVTVVDGDGDYLLEETEMGDDIEVAVELLTDFRNNIDALIKAAKETASKKTVAPKPKPKKKK